MKEASCTGQQRPLTVYPVGGTYIQKSSNASKYTGDVSIYTFFTFTSGETKAIPVYDHRLRKYKNSARIKLSCEINFEA